MLDSMGRTIDYMRISVTDRCNLRCVYCMPEEGIPLLSHSDLLTFEELERVCICGAALGIRKIKLTGGEPLVRKGLPDLVQRLKGIPEIQQVTLTTNGVLLEQFAKALAHSGIDVVNVSLDTLERQAFAKITRRDVLPQVLTGIQSALDAGLRVRLNCVPSRESGMESCLRIAELAKRRPLDVRFIEMMPVGQGMASDGISTSQLRQYLEQAFGVLSPNKERGNGPAVYMTAAGFQGRIGFISAVSEKFCGKCNRVRLTSDGFLKLCLDHGDGVDLRKALRSGVTDTELSEILQKTIFLKPVGHRFEESHIQTVYSMAQIGG